MDVIVSPQKFEHCIDGVLLYAASLEKRLEGIEFTLKKLDPKGEALIAFRQQADFALQELRQIKRMTYLAEEKHKEFADFANW